MTNEVKSGSESVETAAIDTGEKPESSEPASPSSRHDTKGAGDRRARPRRNLGDAKISIKSAALGLVVLALIIGLVVTSWLLIDARSDIQTMNDQAAANAKAEQIATDYSVGAAAMDFTKSEEWKKRLTAGTTTELANRLNQAATSMEQITAPLQWTSTSTPIAATVRSEENGVYVVDCFVSVMTKNNQAPEGVQSTATYSVTVDSNRDWQITDVGGIAAMLGEK